jgi:hypothetical protein
VVQDAAKDDNQDGKGTDQRDLCGSYYVKLLLCPEKLSTLLGHFCELAVAEPTANPNGTGFDSRVMLAIFPLRSRGLRTSLFFQEFFGSPGNSKWRP